AHINETRAHVIAELDEAGRRARRRVDSLAAKTKLLREPLVAHCRGDQWPPTVVACVSSAADRTSLGPCWTALPAAQTEKLEADLEAAVKAGAPEADDMAKALAKMTEFRDQMCACKDTACAQHVQDDMSKWSADMAKQMGDVDMRPDEAMVKK